MKNYLNWNINHSGLNNNKIPISTIIKPPIKWEYLLYFEEIPVNFIVNIAIKNTTKSSSKKKNTYKSV